MPKTQLGEEAQDTQNLETKRTPRRKVVAKTWKMKYRILTQDEVQAAIDNLKKSKASDNNGIRAEDIKTCDATTKDMIRQIFNEVLKQEDCTPETWKRLRIKVIYKKEMWKKLVPTARFVPCQRCTNCSRHSYTTEFTADSTKRNRETREVKTFLPKAGPSCDVQTAGTKMPRVRYQNVGLDSGLHEGISTQ